VGEEQAIRTLFAAASFPWPAMDGNTRRLAALIEGLARAGPVEFWFICNSADPVVSAGDSATAPDGVIVRRIPVRTTGRAERIWRWLTTGKPRATLRYWPLAMPVVDPDAFDVAVLYHLDSWSFLEAGMTVPSIVDFVDLEDQLMLARSRLELSAGHAGKGILERARSLVSLAVDREDARRLVRLQRRAAAAAHAVTVCSEFDLSLLDVSNGRVIPNGYTLDWVAPTARRSVPDPVLLFVGILSYEPNADAARWFAGSVFPLVRQRFPGARLRVVGRGGDWLTAEFEGCPGVEIVGGVDDLRPELDGALVAVVPLRAGSGTRLKVIEALANRLCVVTTTVGCEGIEVEDGRHCLIADDEAGLADAIARALEDDALRAALADEGEALFLRKYRWSTIQDGLVTLAREASGAGPAR